MGEKHKTKNVYMKKITILIHLSLFLCIKLGAQQVDAGKNDTICVPGTQVMLSATYPAENYFYSHWKPGNLFADSTKKDQTVSPTQTTTYYFHAFYQQQTNLVFNGDFQKGNVDFISQYDYVEPNRNALVPEKRYTVASSPSIVHDNFPHHYDHTYGNDFGKFLIVNGAGTPNTVVWQQHIFHITPNTDYVFYAWVLTVNNMNSNDVNELALLQFEIDGQPIGDVFRAEMPRNGWRRFYVVWNSGTKSEEVVIRIINHNIRTSGNDFGIDDIFFAPILPTIDSVTVYVGEHTKQNAEFKICYNEQYEFGERTLTTSGVYYDTLHSSLGCDSIVQLDLTVMDEITTEISVAKCYGEDYLFGGKVLTTSGVYYDTLRSSLGCDSILILTLTVADKMTTEISAVKCYGEDYLFGGKALTTSGVYYDTLRSSLGCDSIVQLTLTITEKIFQDTSIIICFGEEYSLGGKALTTSGVYYDTLRSSLGCDSVFQLTLTVVDKMIADTAVTICYGEQYDFRGRILTASDVYYDTLRSSLGCDSIFQLTLTIADEIILNLGENIQLCRQDVKSYTLTTKENYASYLWKGGSNEKSLKVDQSGDYWLLVSNELGCMKSDTVSVFFSDEVKVEIEVWGEFCENRSVELTAVATNENHCQWNTGAITPTIIVNEPGKYSVTASNEKCVAKATHTVEVCEFCLYFPNAITPSNNDMINDYFCLSAPDDVGTAHIAIYNRFGEAVYVTDNPYFRWDGKHKGELQTSVVYTYIVKVTNKQGRPFVYKGSLLVL